jgi:predicted metal-binding membrane protein
MARASTLETVLRRDRVVVVAALVLVIIASWIYILAGAGMGMSAFEMTAMTPPAGVAGAGDGAPESSPPGETSMAGGGQSVMQGSEGAGMAMQSGGQGMLPEVLGSMAMAMAPAAWTPGYALLMLVMWWVMMVAMMLPSAAPMILLYALIARKQREKGDPYVPTVMFAWGYVLVWGGFSVVAVMAQWGLQRTGLLSSMMASTSVMLGAALLIAAGLYQFTPLKQACLRHCRSPLMFISHHWRPGTLGAVRMGVEHGAFCTGCCWFLMALLLYGGVMNLYWIIGLALFVLLEKSIPGGHWLGRLTGAALIAWGGVLIAGTL